MRKHLELYLNIINMSAIYTVCFFLLFFSHHYLYFYDFANILVIIKNFGSQYGNNFLNWVRSFRSLRTPGLLLLVTLV